MQFIKDACAKYKLDVNKYPFDKIDKLPIRGSSSIKVKGRVTWDPVEKPRDFKPSGHYQRWDTERKNTFKEIAGQTLIDTGYADSMSW